MNDGQLANEAEISLEQQADNSPTPISKPKRNKPMAQTQPEENKLTAIDGGKPPKTPTRFGLLPNSFGGEEVTYKGKVVGEMTWATLPARRIFSMSATGEHPYYKISKSSYADLVTGDVVTAVPANAQQKVYRVTLL